MVLKASDPDALPRASAVLSSLGVAILPCDTIYGIVGVAPQTEERIRSIKGRGEDKPFLQLLPDLGWVRKLSGQELPPRLARLWPGPLTLIVQAKAGGTVGIRLPDSDVLRCILAAVGRPLYSTSVNRAGSSPLNRIEDIRDEFEDCVDLIVDAGALSQGAPSTIVDVTARPYRILRQGSLRLSPEDLEMT